MEPPKHTNQPTHNKNTQKTNAVKLIHQTLPNKQQNKANSPKASKKQQKIDKLEPPKYKKSGNVSQLPKKPLKTHFRTPSSIYYIGRMTLTHQTQVLFPTPP